jgi:hypothetical protein
MTAPLIFFYPTLMKHMTVEDLSHASADRYADRMMHDVKSTLQIRFPPRPPPTFSARESLETPTDDTEDVVSARVTSATVDATSVSTSKSPTTSVKAKRSVQERFQDFYADFERLEPMLSTHLTPEDKKRFVRAIKGPSPLHRPEIVTVVVSILVVIMTAMVCLNTSSPRRESRSRAAPVSPPPPHIATSSTTNFNIERLLKPLNRNR